MANLAQDISKTVVQIKKVLEVWPPPQKKREVFESKKGLWGPKKNFRDPPIKKIDFLQKPEFCDLSEHGGWSKEWPQPPWQCWTSWFNSLNPLSAPASCSDDPAFGYSGPDWSRGGRGSYNSAAPKQLIARASYSDALKYNL